ncbi:MAG TPA: LAGLIDADG family homing endonuclease [Anaerolineaceae bacterium]|nr:LAGLIDADG family homing endonuclease [Anaerolineaceae bacterium]
MKTTSKPLQIGLLPTPAYPGKMPKVELTENARQVLVRRYVRRGDDGQPVESVEEMFWRVAYHVAKAEEIYGQDPLPRAVEYYDLLTTRRFFPNSPTFTGAGTPLGQLAACFVLPIVDDMGRDPAGIFQTLRDAALIQQTGGGNGFSFSRLRPKDSLVKSSAGKATGPVGFLRVYDHAFGEVAQGGCLIPETLVFTSKGLLRLDEIANPEVEGWQSHSLEVATDDGSRQSPRAFNNGRAPILRVHTSQGLSLAGTPEHRVKVMGKEGLEWRTLQDLRPGDWILVKLGQHRGRLQSLHPPQPKHFNQNWPHLPVVLDEELAFFLGYLAGDGFIASQEDDHRVGVSVAHTSYLLEEMPSLLERLFSVKVHRQQKPQDHSVTYVIDNLAVKEFLQMNGLVKPASRDALVPRLVRQSPPEIVAAYLRGLFEADGTLSHGYPSLMTTSARLAEEAATLLIGLGCPVAIRSISPGTTHYGKLSVFQVRITSTAGLQAWRKKIGCDLRSRFVACYAWENDQSRESTYVLPNPRYWLQPVLDAITLEQVDARGRGLGRKFRSQLPALRRSILRYYRANRQFTRSAFEELAREYGEFSSLARSPQDSWFVRITGIEPAGEALTLDLEVDENHTYLAYGMVTHNTRRGANMAVLRVDHPDVEDFVTCKVNENQITNFNISVGITDAFMRAVEADADWDLRFPDVSAPEYKGFRGTLEQAEAEGVPIKVHKTLRARDLFAKIVRQAHHNGEPGVLFLDAANRGNPVPHLYALEATNPCVTGETLVATPSGWIRADQIHEGDSICTVLGAGRIASIEVNENVPVFDLYLSDGAIVRATAAHQFHVRDSRTKFFEPRRLDELKPGEWIRVYRSSIPKNPVPGKLEHMTDHEYGFMVGVLVGDGCYTPHALSKNVVRISTHADEKEWNSILENAFAKVGVEKMYSYINTNSRSMMMDPKPGRVIAGWVKSLPLEPASGPQKRLPNEYINSNQEFLTGLLDGLFSTDGSVDLQSNHPLLRYHTSSLELARQLRRILLMFGIYARIATSQRQRHTIDGRVIRYDRPKYDITISGDSLGRFFDQIRLSHPEKQMRLEEAALKSNFTGGNWAAKVVKVVPAGVDRVYDIYEPKSDTWITEGFVSRGCGEQWLGPYENCCLGSVNLAEHCGPDGTVDWEKLRQSVVLSTLFLDNVVDANAYVPAVPQLKEAALRARRIGMGIMGLADLMYHVGIRYGSEEGQEFAAQIMEFVRYHTMQTSIELAKTRGPFPAIPGSRYDRENPQWQPPESIAPLRSDWGRPQIDWNVVTRGILEYGIRNAAQTTVAPTGTIATVAGCEGYGCEPVFALAYIRHVNDQGKDLQLTYASPQFEAALEQAGLDETQREAIVEKVMREGTCQTIPEVPAAIRDVFVVSGDITAEEHVRMQAALQAFVDNSLSKTINFPENATEEEVATAYQLAWELGCKGITVYVTGSREKVVLETKATVEKKQAAEAAPAPASLAATEDTTAQLAMWREAKKPRPRSLRGYTYSIETPLGKAFITINENGGDQPFEVFINTAKAGSDTAAVSEAIGRLISFILRIASPIRPRERLHEVMRQLVGIGGGRSLGFGPNRVRSLPDGVAHVLDDYLQSTEAQHSEAPAPGMNGNGAVHEVTLSFVEQPPLLKIGDLCPECGQASVVNEEGCRKCYSCGFSEC